MSFVVYGFYGPYTAHPDILTATTRGNTVVMLMSNQARTYLKFGGAVVVILLSLGYLAYTGVQESKSYYVTIKELKGMGDGAYTKHLRVAGNVQPDRLSALVPELNSRW